MFNGKINSMIKIGKYQTCVCRGRSNPDKLCDGVYTFEEKGKKVTLEPKAGEEALAVVIDGCVCADNDTKCDGMFLYRRSSKRWIILVELKGTDLEHAFEQLAYTKMHRPEYKEIHKLFSEENRHFLTEKSFIVSNRIIHKVEHKKLEIRHRIRVSHILHSAATTPVPNLRMYL
jgi:hypothetical protein